MASTIVMAGVSGCASTEAGPRLAGNLGTRICVINSWTDTINVTYPTKDTSTGEGDLQPGAQSCAEGTRFNGTDVGGEIMLPSPALPFEVGATNPWFGAPSAWIKQREGRDPNEYAWFNTHLCTDKSGMDVGESRSWDNGTERITITRSGDDQWKEFTLTIGPSQGQRVGNDPCAGAA